MSKHSHYSIVRRGYEVATEAYYAPTLEIAISVRDNLMNETGRDWRIFENIEDVTESKFWRWIAKRTDALRERLYN